MSSPFDKQQLSFLKQLITNRNKELRHEVSDHLDNTLPVRKLKGHTGPASLETDADGNTAWVESSSGLYVPKSIGDAKGDLIGFSADNTPVRIPAAAGDGYGLISDSSQSGGVGWTKAPIEIFSGSSFPSSPEDGQLAIYEGGGFSWMFQYDAGSAQTHKWNFIGGGHLATFNDSIVTTTSTTYAAPTGAMSITVPLAGTYMIEIAAYIYSSTVATAHINYAFNGAAQADAYGANSDGQQGNSVMRVRPAVLGTAGGTLAERIKVGAGTGTYLRRSMSILPIRCG